MNDNTENHEESSAEEKKTSFEELIEQKENELNNEFESSTQDVSMEKLEELRIIVKNQILKIIVITALVFVLVLVIFGFEAISLFWFVVVFCFILVIFVPAKNKRNLNDAYKQYFVKKTLQSIFSDLEYKPYSGIKRDTIDVTGMMSTGDIFSSNDLVEGKYNGIKFRQSDIEIQNESTDSDGDTTYTTIFKGRWMIFDFNKTFKANVQVAQKGFGGAIRRKRYKGEEKYKRVKLESHDFNKRFKVFAQSELEAFYILTPHMMERIIKLDNDNQGKMMLCFYNNKLHVAINDGKDSFEYTSYFKKINEQNELEKTSKDIKLITSFIEDLNLENDIFRKEV